MLLLNKLYIEGIDLCYIICTGLTSFLSIWTDQHCLVLQPSHSFDSTKQGSPVWKNWAEQYKKQVMVNPKKSFRGINMNLMISLLVHLIVIIYLWFVKLYMYLCKFIYNTLSSCPFSAFKSFSFFHFIPVFHTTQNFLVNLLYSMLRDS